MKMKMKKILPLLILFIILLSSKLSAVDAVKFDNLRRSLVVIETDAGRGSGFIIEMNEKKYIMTNFHVIRHSKRTLFRLVDGQQLTPQNLELADDIDLARAQLPDSITGVIPLKLSKESPTINDIVKIYGNSEGQGAVTELDGKVLGVGPDTIEVDATFVSGNSGSPILKDDGTVIGVATYTTRGSLGADWVASGTRFEQTRRFGVRTSSSIKWVSVLPTVLQAQSTILDNTWAYLCSVYRIALCWDYRADRTTTRSLFIAYASNQKTTVVEPTPWDNSIEVFAGTYRTYWGYQEKVNRNGQGINVSPHTTSLQNARRTMLRRFNELPSQPISQLITTRWVTKTLANEAALRQKDIAFLKDAIQFVVKEESVFWKENVLKRDY